MDAEKHQILMVVEIDDIQFTDPMMVAKAIADPETVLYAQWVIKGEKVQLEHNHMSSLYNVHSPEVCAGRPCTIHNRTDHRMRSFPQHFREDRGLMERICPHGIGHPDPDSPEDIDWVHGCDGCCQEPSGEQLELDIEGAMDR